jgi:primosomal protein N' (replication factor Y)
VSHDTLFADIAIPVPVRQTFTYRVPPDLVGRATPGRQVTVPFGRRTAEGFIVGLTPKAPAVDPSALRDLKEIDQAGPAFSAELLELTRWVADYYLCSWGEALKAALPGGIEPSRAEPKRGRKRAVGAADAALDPGMVAAGLAGRTPTLTPEQADAGAQVAEALRERRHQVFLLFGVTGSGKTEVYLRAAALALAAGGQCLLLVPEISLSPQMVDRCRDRFGDSVVVWHSQLPAGRRREAWRQVADGTARVVVGARSAVFAPFCDLRLIVIDEEHEPAYKQDDAPRYHGRDVAIVRAHRLGIPVLLGSATPSLETFHHVESGKYRLLELPRRIENRPVPEVRLVALERPGDRRDTMPDGREDDRPAPPSPVLSEPLLQGLRRCLGRSEQAILFLNRRGHSTVVRCRDCGWVARCPHCDIALTWHVDRRELRCHYCAYRARNFDTCPTCAGATFHFKGIGTQKVEAEIERLLPAARFLRMDFDSTRRRGALEKIVEEFRQRRADILLGTQMVARGLDFPGVTLVGVINADTQLNLPDFRSAERTFQLLTQVAGRAGRGDIPGEVVVQTFAPGHYAVDTARRQDYRAFFEAEMVFRREVDYPPVSRMVSLLFDGKDEARVMARADEAAARLAEFLREGKAGRAKVDLLGPAPRSLSRLKGKYRWHLTLKGHDHRALRALAEAALALPPETGASAVRLSIDVDPMSLL